MDEQQALQFGTFIKEHRLKKGIGARELARQAELNISTISRLEHGKYRRPSAATLKRIAIALNIEASDVMAAARMEYSAKLPGLPTYLRVQYAHMSPEQLASIEAYIGFLMAKGGPGAPSPERPQGREDEDEL